jgi:hypothetical protein
MKKVMLLLILASCNQPKKLNRTNDRDMSVVNQSLYTVYKIDSVHNWYLIYARKQDSLFKIVSQKEATTPCLKIHEKGIYAFQLHGRFAGKFLGRDDLSAKNLPVSGYGFDDSTTIVLERGMVRDLFIADNIKGLCYIK